MLQNDDVKLKKLLYNTFKDKINLEASNLLVNVRSRNYKINKKEKYYRSVWDIKPIDFSWKLYHPLPKLNLRREREAIDELKNTDDDNSSDSSIDEIIENGRRKILIKNLFRDEKSNASLNEKKRNFEIYFKIKTPDTARLEASRTMGYREGLNSYKTPTSHDFRGLKFLYGMPVFTTKTQRDPYNTKFLTENLDTIHGIKVLNDLRDIDDDIPQMGDSKITPEPKFNSNLVLPKLVHPNKCYAYTRHRPPDRSVESAFWDRVLPKVNQRLKNSSSIENFYTKRIVKNSRANDLDSYLIDEENKSSINSHIELL